MAIQQNPPIDLAAEHDALARASARESLHEAWVDDVRAKLAINRAVYAAGYGLDPRPYAGGMPQPVSPPAPQPAPQPTSVNATSESHAGWLPAAAMFAALLAGGAGVGGLISMLSRSEPAPATSMDPLRGTIRFWVDGPDGPVEIEHEPN